MKTRRMILTAMAGIAATAPLGLPALADIAPPPPPPADPFAEGTFVLGPKDAAITVTEFASMTCPHCAHFTLSTFPEVKKQFIDTGKIRFVFRDFPLDQIALQASQLVRCAGPERAEALVDLLFRTQATWARAADPIAVLKQTVKLAGVGDAKADACLADEALKLAVAQSRFDAEKQYQIRSTPSFAIGTKIQSGALTIEEFTAFLKDNGLKD
ncbi:DsbA family protein [Zavarzinia compransoris]|uniref:Disulfide bond formation protein DsbA n=1 Tax=Zavarzinia compransoris TaxID=1264899 RepID=A0A317EBM3_9PROT|nr:DsbA family protein [Zavarzinia compransoris]PWR23530.1 disulfide bond formation protein DsbA [Zavarzinia compransoris]TDP47740.1 thioredoxin-like protein [Zavarzinia compransoris]